MLQSPVRDIITRARFIMSSSQDYFADVPDRVPYGIRFNEKKRSALTILVYRQVPITANVRVKNGEILMAEDGSNSA